MTKTEVVSELNFIVAHDYLLIKGENCFKDSNEAGIQIPIQEAKLILLELLKEDFLKEEHVQNYPCYNHTKVTIKSNGWVKSKII